MHAGFFSVSLVFLRGFSYTSSTGKEGGEEKEKTRKSKRKGKERKAGEKPLLRSRVMYF